MIGKPILLCDLDETIFDLLGTILPYYNEKYNQNLKIEDITDYNVTQFLHDKTLNIFKEFSSEKLFNSLKPMGNSVEILTELNDKTFLYFPTAGYVETINWRDKLLRKHFSFYKTEQLIMCKHKQLLKGNALIDDYSQQLFGGEYKPIIFSRNWNKNIVKRGLYRINRWDDDALKVIKEALEIK